MAHDIRLTDRANREQAEMLFEAVRIVSKDDGEPWQQQERERELREQAAKWLGEE